MFDGSFKVTTLQRSHHLAPVVTHRAIEPFIHPFIYPPIQLSNHPLEYIHSSVGLLSPQLSTTSPIHPSIISHPPIHPSPTNLFIPNSPTHLSTLFIHPPIHPPHSPIYPPHLTIHSPIHPPTPFTHPFIYPIHPSIQSPHSPINSSIPFTHPSIHPFIHPPLLEGFLNFGEHYPPAQLLQVTARPPLRGFQNTSPFHPLPQLGGWCMDGLMDEWVKR